MLLLIAQVAVKRPNCCLLTATIEELSDIFLEEIPSALPILEWNPANR